MKSFYQIFIHSLITFSLILVGPSTAFAEKEAKVKRAKENLATYLGASFDKLVNLPGKVIKKTADAYKQGVTGKVDCIEKDSPFRLVAEIFQTAQKGTCFGTNVVDDTEAHCSCVNGKESRQVFGDQNVVTLPEFLKVADELREEAIKLGQYKADEQILAAVRIEHFAKGQGTEFIKDPSVYNTSNSCDFLSEAVKKDFNDNLSTCSDFNRSLLRNYNAVIAAASIHRGGPHPYPANATSQTLNLNNPLKWGEGSQVERWSSEAKSYKSRERDANYFRMSKVIKLVEEMANLKEFPPYGGDYYEKLRVAISDDPILAEWDRLSGNNVLKYKTNADLTTGQRYELGMKNLYELAKSLHGQNASFITVAEKLNPIRDSIIEQSRKTCERAKKAYVETCKVADKPIEEVAKTKEDLLALAKVVANSGNFSSDEKEAQNKVFKQRKFDQFMCAYLARNSVDDSAEEYVEYIDENGKRRKRLKHWFEKFISSVDGKSERERREFFKESISNENYALDGSGDSLPDSSPEPSNETLAKSPQLPKVLPTDTKRADTERFLGRAPAAFSGSSIAPEVKNVVAREDKTDQSLAKFDASNTQVVRDISKDEEVVSIAKSNAKEDDSRMQELIAKIEQLTAKADEQDETIAKLKAEKEEVTKIKKQEEALDKLKNEKFEQEKKLANLFNQSNPPSGRRLSAVAPGQKGVSDTAGFRVSNVNNSGGNVTVGGDQNNGVINNNINVQITPQGGEELGEDKALPDSNDRFKLTREDGEVSGYAFSVDSPNLVSPIVEKVYLDMLKAKGFTGGEADIPSIFVKTKDLNDISKTQFLRAVPTKVGEDYSFTYVEPTREELAMLEKREIESYIQDLKVDSVQATNNTESKTRRQRMLERVNSTSDQNNQPNSK